MPIHSVLVTGSISPQSSLLHLGEITHWSDARPSAGFVDQRVLVGIAESGYSQRSGIYFNWRASGRLERASRMCTKFYTASGLPGARCIA